MNFISRIKSLFSSELSITSSKVVFGGDLVAGNFNEQKTNYQKRKIENIISKNIETFNFTSLKIDSYINVVFTQSENISVVITGEEHVVPLVKVKNNNGTLIISMKNSNGIIYNELTVHVSSPFVEKVTHNCSGKLQLLNINHKNLNIEKDGSGDILMNGVCKDFTVQQSGSGKINLNQLICEFIDISKNGSGRLNISGTCKNIHCDIEGAGDTNLSKLIVEKVTLKKEGAGSCKIYASNEINGSIQGAGSLHVYGQPKQRNVSKAGVGNIQYQGK